MKEEEEETNSKVKAGLTSWTNNNRIIFRTRSVPFSLDRSREEPSNKAEEECKFNLSDPKAEEEGK